MSDTREALMRVQFEHQDTTGCGCRCGESFRTWDEKRAHVAELISAEFLVVPRSDVQGYEYGWRYTHPYGVRTYRAEDRADAIEDARYQRRLELHERQLVTGEALERPVLPWTPIPLPEDGDTNG